MTHKGPDRRASRSNSCHAGWEIVELAFDIRHARACEGLFTLGSRYLHVRGSLEEHINGAPQDTTYTHRPANVTSEKFPDTKTKWGTYVPGVFGQHLLLNNEMINMPWFLAVRLGLMDEAWSFWKQSRDIDSTTCKRGRRKASTSPTRAVFGGRRSSASCTGDVQPLNDGHPR